MSPHHSIVVCYSRKRAFLPLLSKTKDYSKKEEDRRGGVSRHVNGTRLPHYFQMEEEARFEGPINPEQTRLQRHVS